MGQDEQCPACRSVFYPRLGFSGRARLVLAGACLLSGLCWFFGTLVLLALLPKGGVGRDPRSAAAVLLWFPVALVPGLLLGRLALRFPKVVRGHCRCCGWRGHWMPGELPGPLPPGGDGKETNAGA
jgi:hypothetical protein